MMSVKILNTVKNNSGFTANVNLSFHINYSKTPSSFCKTIPLLTLIRAAIKKSVAGRLKVIYDPHIVQWEAGFL
jgi:hypothetical protein